MIVRLLTAALGTLVLIPPSAGAGGSFRAVDGDGSVHYTNAPTSARFERMKGSGTDAGFLRLPPGLPPARFGEEIDEAATRYGVPRKLIEAVIRAESAFNRVAVSPKGAQGLMQLMPQTASALGVQDAFDARQNIGAGVRHLRGLMDRFPQDLSLALAAYNAGERAVTTHRGVPPYPETQQYVRKIMADYGSAGDAPMLRAPVFRLVHADGTVTFTNVAPSRSGLRPPQGP